MRLILGGLTAPNQSSKVAATPRPDLLTTIGSRVRRAREEHAMTRRKLSELSGVSQRFLAQLEAGTANISVVRLKAVADVLGLPIDGLLGSLPVGSPPAVCVPESDLQVHPNAVAALYRQAPVEAQREVLGLLVRSLVKA